MRKYKLAEEIIESNIAIKNDIAFDDMAFAQAIKTALLLTNKICLRKKNLNITNKEKIGQFLTLLRRELSNKELPSKYRNVLHDVRLWLTPGVLRTRNLQRRHLGEFMPKLVDFAKVIPNSVDDDLLNVSNSLDHLKNSMSTFELFLKSITIVNEKSDKIMEEIVSAVTND
jgi:hypothetical protein